MAKIKATHSGTCQCCGARQKLPGGRLATHGYTVECGFFSGVCRGTGHLPFEESCDLIKTFIAEARDQLKFVQEEQEMLLQPATEAKAWVHHYHPAEHRKRGGYRWHRVEVIAKTVTLRDDYSFQQFFYTLDGQEHKIDTYSVTQELLPVCTHLNEKKARSMDRTVEQIERYIAWQEERVVTWKPGTLVKVA